MSLALSLYSSVHRSLPFPSHGLSLTLAWLAGECLAYMFCIVRVSVCGCVTAYPWGTKDDQSSEMHTPYVSHALPVGLCRCLNIRSVDGEYDPESKKAFSEMEF